VVHTCNSSYLRGRDRRKIVWDHTSKPHWAWWPSSVVPANQKTEIKES
jgi:hypothetical protein